MTATTYAQVSSALRIVKNYLNKYIFGRNGPTAYEGLTPQPHPPFLDSALPCVFDLLIHCASPEQLGVHLRDPETQVKSLLCALSTAIPPKKTQWKVGDDSVLPSLRPLRCK
jgi:hypothetical protein